jgi:hypothetical protein
MSDITVINDSEQSSLVTNGLAKNGELYLKAAGSTDAGAIVVYDSGSWRTFANEASAGFANTYSVDFDGTNDYVEIPAASELSFTDGSGNDSAFSLSAWVYIDSLSNFTLLTKGVYNSTGEYHVRMTGAQKMQLVLYMGTNPAYEACFIDQSLSTGQWYHFAFTYDGRGGTSANAGILGYLNGSLSAVSRAGGGSYSGMISSSAPLYIGKNSTNYSNGKIDEVALFNSALSASDVTAIYNSGVPADLTSYSPVGWWRMGDDDSGTGTTITDQGSGSNDGTLTNGPTFSTDVPS